jgi:hypothetical protein
MDNGSMINPKAVTNFNRTSDELEEFLMFSIVVAGKGAFQQASKLEEFRLKLGGGRGPFNTIRVMEMDGTLDFFLRSVKMGQYNRIGTAFRGISNFFRHDFDNERFHPLKTVPVKYLECVKGIGMKTARFFVMHTRPNQMYACLDTHILKWLGEKGHEVPKSTPQNQKYLDLEKIFLDYAAEMNMMPAELDLKIWNEKHQ